MQVATIRLIPSSFAARVLLPSALRRLKNHDWPGNVRELQHQILRICAFARGPVVRLRDVKRYSDLPAEAAASVSAPTGRKVESLEELEKKQIQLALEQANGNKTRAAKLLGINRATLFRKLKRFNL